MNELEFSPNNYDILIKRGYEPLGGSSTVKGIQDIANSIRKFLDEQDNQLDLMFHFCTSDTKDNVQLKKRYIHRARKIKKPFEEVTDEGTILLGRIKIIDEHVLNVLINDLRENYELDETLMRVVSPPGPRNTFVETGWFVLEEIGGELKQKYGNKIKLEIIEKYPLDKEIIVMSLPI